MYVHYRKSSVPLCIQIDYTTRSILQGLAMLHWACDRGHLDVVKFLISRGADVNVQDSDLQTPLHYGKSRIL